MRKQKYKQILSSAMIIFGLSNVANANSIVECRGPQPVPHCFNHPMTLILTFGFSHEIQLFHDDVLDTSFCGWPPYTVLSNDFAQAEYLPPNGSDKIRFYNLYERKITHLPEEDHGEQLTFQRYGRLKLMRDENHKIKSGTYVSSSGSETELTCNEKTLEEKTEVSE